MGLSTEVLVGRVEVVLGAGLAALPESEIFFEQPGSDPVLWPKPLVQSSSQADRS
jgi:hypothetical protein